jgi:hypothetical protein
MASFHNLFSLWDRRIGVRSIACSIELVCKSPKQKKTRNNKDLLDIEDGVSWVHGSLVLRRFTDQTLLVGEAYE